MAIDLIENNPLLKKPLLAILSLCDGREEVSRGAVERMAAEIWEGSYRQSPSTSVEILVRHGALAERLFVDGEPYEGTIEDMQFDECLSDDATAESRLAITDDGRDLLDAYAPEKTLADLFDSHSRYRDVYCAAIGLCCAAQGCSREGLEGRINRFPQLKPDPATGRTNVYPQYFIDALETAGGIVWSGGSWHATEEGRAFVRLARA